MKHQKFSRICLSILWCMASRTRATLNAEQPLGGLDQYICPQTKRHNQFTRQKFTKITNMRIQNKSDVERRNTPRPRLLTGLHLYSKPISMKHSSYYWAQRALFYSNSYYLWLICLSKLKLLIQVITQTKWENPVRSRSFSTIWNVYVESTKLHI